MDHLLWSDLWRTRIEYIVNIRKGHDADDIKEEKKDTFYYKKLGKWDRKKYVLFNKRIKKYVDIRTWEEDGNISETIQK